MQKILEELWYGNVCPVEGYSKPTKESKELIGHIAKHHDALLSTMTDAQKEMLDKFLDCRDELMCLHEKEIFTYAFRLGARMAMEVMSFEVL